MKVKKKSKRVIEVFEIDYENGVKCEYTINNNKLSNYSFKSGKQQLSYVNYINDLSNQHWSNHHKFVKMSGFTIEELKSFSQFDNLYYVGGGMDGMVKDRNGVFVSTLIIMDEIFSQCYLNIEKKESKCQEILDSLDKEFIVKSKIIEIPYYNQSDYKKHHYTIWLSVKLPNDLYNKFIEGQNSLNDNIKVKIFEYLKTKKLQDNDKNLVQ